MPSIRRFACPASHKEFRMLSGVQSSSAGFLRMLLIANRAKFSHVKAVPARLVTSFLLLVAMNLTMVFSLASIGLSCRFWLCCAGRFFDCWEGFVAVDIDHRSKLGHILGQFL